MWNFVWLGVTLVLIYFLVRSRIEVKKLGEAASNHNEDREQQLEQTSEELRKKARELVGLFEVARAVTSTLDLEGTLKTIAEKAVDIMNADVGSLRLLDEKKQELVSRGSYGLSKDHIKKGTLKVGESIAGRVIQECKPMAVTDLKKEKRMKYTDYIVKDGLCSLLSAPVILNQKPVGVITVYTKTIHSFSEEEIALFSSFADHIAVAIDNSRLYEDLKNNYFSTISALALAVEARDPYTRGHSERVTRYAIEIAKEMGIMEEDIQTLQFAGKLHDIGKIGISDSILLKPAKLTFVEFAEIKRHPVKGTEMLEPLEFIKAALPAIRHHHERFNGDGYPEGLKGSNVPILARILAVADTFDAMTSERPYRAPMSQEKAIGEIRKNSGIQFDPKVVGTFLSIIEKGEKLPGGSSSQEQK